MKYKRLTATGVVVSELSLGTMEFGGRVPKDDAIRMTHYALDNGVNFIDTANVYQDGLSETVLGEALQGRRNDVVLATKVRLTRHPEKINSEGLNRRAIMREVEASLKRLRTDWIDVYYLHVPDPDTPLEETVDTIGDLIRSGKIRYWGVSNYASWQLADMDSCAIMRNVPRPILSENVYNLLCRSVEPELVPCLRTHKIGMTVFNPLAGGLLTGKHSLDKIVAGRFDGNKQYQDRYWNADSFRGVELLRPVAEAAGLTLVGLSIKWCAQHDFVDSVLIGATSIQHLENNLHALEGDLLSAEILSRCDEVWSKISDTRYQYNR